MKKRVVHAKNVSFMQNMLNNLYKNTMLFIGKTRRKNMGRVIKPEEIKNMTGDMKQSWTTLEIKLYTILDYLNSLIASEDFKGKTAESFKMQMQHHKSVINAILYELGKGLEYCEALENEVGFVDLIEDDIIDQIHSLRNLNEMLEDDIAELRNKPRDILHRIMDPVGYEQVCLNYEYMISRNELLIKALERKLQKIDEIEANVNGLFNTDGIYTIKAAIRTLHEGFSETDFVPITYPSICAITKLQSLGDKNPDPMGIRTGLDERFITVLNDDGTEKKGKNNIELGFGGNQDWIDLEISESSCGVVAAVNTYLYITGQTTITESEYVGLCKQFYNEHPLNTILIRKVGAVPSAMGDYIEDRCREHGLSIKTSWNWYKGSDQYDTMKKMLADNIPVIWGLYSCRKELTLYRYNAGNYIQEKDYDKVNSHYVVATAIYEQEQTDGSYRRMVEVSSWGKRFYIDYDEYLDYTTSFYQEHPEYVIPPDGMGQGTIDGEAIVNTIGSNIVEIKID